MRTRDVTDPKSWRAWDGKSFNVSLAVNPYTDPNLQPAQHICHPLTKMTYPSLLWSTYLKSYLIFGTTDGHDNTGWSFQLITDLATPQLSAPVAVTTGANIKPGGNGTKKTPTRPVPGLWARSINGIVLGTQIWWLKRAAGVLGQVTSKHRVHSCTPCGVPACVDPVTGKSNLRNIAIKELDAIKEGPTFGCDMIGGGGSGAGSYIYPSLIDETAPSADLNFETVGATASLFLVTNDCISWQNVSGHGMRCNPWDSDGIVHRSVTKLPVAFHLKSDDSMAPV